MSYGGKKMSGSITISGSSAAVPLGTGTCQKAIWIHASASNGGVIYIGNDGNDTVSATTGFSMDAGDTIVLDYVKKLEQVYVHASAGSQVVSYIEVEASRTA